MNNNRNNNSSNNNNNRRRGRGNRNQGGGGGGGAQGNRIDSRARGNAPQMLDKYKKLAQDAQHHGDRVQAEYYLQFADHYFRVIADNNRSRQDEPRTGRRDERDQDDFDLEDQADGDDRMRFESREPREVREPREPREVQAPRELREPRREPRPRRDDRPDNRPVFRQGRDVDSGQVNGDGADEPRIVEAAEGPVFAPEDNPFMREDRPERNDRTESKPRRAPRASARPGRANAEDAGIDAAVLPPSISANDAGESEAYDQPAAAPRPRRKRSDGGTLSAVG